MDCLLSARTALLQALAMPGYGLDLAARVSTASGGRIELRPGSLYPALRRLQRDGLIVSRPAARAAGRGRPGRDYELTAEGVRVAAEQRASLLGLLRGNPTPAAPVNPATVRRGVEACAELSEALLDLRRRVRAAVRSKP